MEKKKYNTPEIEIVIVSKDDIIRTSNVGGGVIVTPEDNF